MTNNQVLAKADPRLGGMGEWRHTMDDTDISATRHARAAVVIATPPPGLDRTY
jgi:hypothetical protein